MNQRPLLPKAVLFDMDGVLYDSMPYHVKAWQEVANKYSLPSSAKDFYLFEGKTGESTIDALFLRTFNRHATPQEVQRIYGEKTERFNTYNKEERPMRGAAQVLAQVKASGMQTLVVTGSGQYNLIERLNQHYPGYFEREKMVTASDVVYGKPHPEPYLMGLQKAGVQAHEALVVENAPMGIQSAVAAGIFTIAVNTGILHDNVLLKAGANCLYADMLSLAADWQCLLDKVSGALCPKSK